jgi:hypothetical protein
MSPLGGDQRKFLPKNRRWRKNRLILTDRGTNILPIVREPLANKQYPISMFREFEINIFTDPYINNDSQSP